MRIYASADSLRLPSVGGWTLVYPSGDHIRRFEDLPLSCEVFVAFIFFFGQMCWEIKAIGLGIKMGICWGIVEECPLPPVKLHFLNTRLKGYTAETRSSESHQFQQGALGG